MEYHSLLGDAMTGSQSASMGYLYFHFPAKKPPNLPPCRSGFVCYREYPIEIRTRMVIFVLVWWGWRFHPIQHFHQKLPPSPGGHRKYQMWDYPHPNLCQGSPRQRINPTMVITKRRLSCLLACERRNPERWIPQHRWRLPSSWLRRTRVPLLEGQVVAWWHSVLNDGSWELTALVVSYEAT